MARWLREPEMDAGLGQAEFLGLLGSAISAGGAIGASFISADATKYAADDQRSASIVSEIIRTKALLAVQDQPPPPPTKPFPLVPVALGVAALLFLVTR